MNGFETLGGMRGALLAGRISAVELLDLHLERIARYNPALNAIVALDVEGARAAAWAADERRARGHNAPLLGLPITIKDAIDMAGLPTTGGVPRRRAAVPEADAPVVSRLRAAGAVILGKTNTPPYASDWQTDNALFGRTVNPWDAERTPGGSTGGGAAAVAAGLSPLEIGSDIGGSIRVPAAFCGIFGHRPSDSAVPRSGHFPGSPLPNLAKPLNVLGPLARSAEDLDRVLAVIAGPDAGEHRAWKLVLPTPRHVRLDAYRVALLPLPEWLPVDVEIVAARERVVDALGALGAHVAEAQPAGFGDLRAHHRLYEALMAAVFSHGVNLSEERRRREADELRATGDDFDLARAHGLLASAGDYLDWHAERERYRAAYRQFFVDWDVLLAPVTISLPFPHDARPFAERVLTIDGRTVPYGWLKVFPGVATLSGQPATAFPAGVSAAGLPIGLQAIGPYLEDCTTLRFAALLAAEIDGYRPPPGFGA